MIKGTLMPRTLYFADVRHIPLEDLKAYGISLLLLDADNTLRYHHDDKPFDFVPDFLCRAKALGFDCVLTSNSMGKNVCDFAKSIGIECEHLCKKPLPFRINRIFKKRGYKRAQVSIIGDQIFTDILCAKLCGIKGILVSPAKYEDGISFKIRRFLEKPIVRRIKKNER